MSDHGGKPKSPGAERRLDERVPTQVRVRLKYPDVETFLERYATNISRGGIFIQTQRTKPAGTLIRFEFQLQDASPVIRGEGRVSWVVPYDPAHAERAYGMGVKFTKLDGRSKSLIDRVVAQKMKRGHPDAGDAPPPIEAAELAPARDVVAREAPSLAPPPPAAPQVERSSDLDEEVKALLSGPSSIEIRALVQRVLGQGPFDAGSMDKLLGELESVAGTKHVPRPRKRVSTAKLPVAAAPEVPSEVPSEVASEVAPEVAPLPQTTAAPSPPSMVEPSRVPTQPPPPVPTPERIAKTPTIRPELPSIGERIDRLLDRPAAGAAFELDLDGLAPSDPFSEPSPRVTPPPRRSTPLPASSGRTRTPAPRAFQAPPAPEAVPSEPMDAERELPRLGSDWDQITVVPDGTEPTSYSQFDITPPSRPPIEVTPPGIDITPAGLDLTPPEAVPIPDLGFDSLGGRGEDPAFSMDDAPLIEEGDSGPAERTVIGGSVFDFAGPTARARLESPGFPTAPLIASDLGSEITATQPGLEDRPAAGPVVDDPAQQAGAFDEDALELPPDAGAQQGMPILDEPLVDDFDLAGETMGDDPAEAVAAEGVGEAFFDMEMEPAGLGHDALLDDVPLDVGTGPSLDDGLAFSGAVASDALDPFPLSGTERDPFPDGGTIKQPVAPGADADELSAIVDDHDDAPKKGFFRKLFGNK